MDNRALLKREELLSCLELGKTITAELESGRLFTKILMKLSELLPAEHWSLLLLDEKTGELRFEIAVGLDLDLVRGVRLSQGEGIAGEAVLQKTVMVVPDVKECEFFSSKVDQLSGGTTRSVVCVPLIFGGRCLGVIEVVNPRNLGENALPLLSIIADYAAIAVENMLRYRNVQELAIRDNLTGLFNTRYLYEAIPQLISDSDADNKPFSLIFLDIDDFKQVVDRYGHLMGSRALQEVAQTLKGCIAWPAFGVAYGGDEFVVVLPGCDRHHAREKALEIRQQMGRTTYLADHGHAVRLTGSFGLATYPGDATDMTGILARADQAMFHVKRHGKDEIRCA